jgi:hypothetical protein
VKEALGLLPGGVARYPGKHSLKLGTPGLTALLLTAIHSVNAVSFAPDASFTNEQKQVQADLAEC